MKKYRVEVTRTVEYEVEVDESIFNEANKTEFERHFWELPDGETPSEQFARALAEQSCRLGVNTFIEGFGKCGSDKELVAYWNKQPNHQDDQYTDGLYIYEDYDGIESEIEEIKED